MKMFIKDLIQEYSVRNKEKKDYPVYSVTNSQGFCKDYFGKEVASKDKSTYKIVPYGCFAYNPSRINVGSIDWQHCEDFVIVSPLYNVFTVNTNITRRDYLSYYFKSRLVSDYINTFAKGSVRLNVPLSTLGNFPVPIPPLAEQQRIVAELDLLSSIIEKKKAQLKELDQLAQSIFYDMFGDPITNEKGWEVKTIGDFVNVKGGFAFKSNGYTQSGVRLVQIANVWKDNLKWDDIVFVSNENANNCSDYLLNKGDIVMAMTRPIIKSLEAVKIAVVSEEDLPCILNQRVCKFDLHNGLNSIWLYQFLRLPFFKNKIDLFGSKGMQPNVSSREIESIPLFLPPIHLQEIFADKVEAIEKQKSLIQQSIKETLTLFNSRMDYYFN